MQKSRGRGGQGGCVRKFEVIGCERRIEVFVKIKKKKWGEGGRGSRVGDQGGCERRIGVFVKIKKNRILSILQIVRNPI